MNALESPAAAGADERPFTFDFDRSDWLRVVGGMMFATGALVLLIRKSPSWGAWAEVAALLIPALILLGVAFADRVPTGGEGWKAAFLVFGTLLLLVALLRVVGALHGHPRGWNLVWTFAVAAGVAVFSSLALRVPFQMLLGALLGTVVWLALWEKILSNPKPSTLQWLLVVLAIIYFALSVLLMRAGRVQALDLITAASLTAVLAAAFTFAGLAPRIGGLAAASAIPSGVPKPAQGWNIFLLVVSLLSIGFGSRGPTRGPSYVGALGLAAFIGLVGVDAVHRLNGGEAGGVVGWPLILLIIGAGLAAAGFLGRPAGPGQGAYAAPPPATTPGAPSTAAPPQPHEQQPPPPTQQHPGPGEQPTQVHQQPPPPEEQPPQQ
jgi:hypothetical protein